LQERFRVELAGGGLNHELEDVAYDELLVVNDGKVNLLGEHHALGLLHHLAQLRAFRLGFRTHEPSSRVVLGNEEKRRS
jgi:hypothetical protein